MKKNLFYPAVSIDDVMDVLGRDINNSDNYRFSLQTLDIQADKHYTERMLSGAVDSVVHRLNYGSKETRFEWKATGKYAPDIRFSVTDSAGPSVDENGFLGSPILYANMVLILPFLNYDFRGNTARALMAWGFYERMDVHGTRLEDINNPSITDGQKYFWRTGGGGQVEIIHNFCQGFTNEATHLLLAVPWGGAYSDTRGQSEKTLEKLGYFEQGLEFFQQCASAKQGEGYDFYIIDIAKAVAEDAMEELRTQLSYSFDRVMITRDVRANDFLRKYNAFQARDKEHDKFLNEVLEIGKRAQTRYQAEVKCNTIAMRSYVVLPEKICSAQSVYDELKIPVRPADWTCGLKELNQARITDEDWDKLRVVEDTLNAQMDAWLDFAPLYADLAEVVVQKCHGTAELNLTCLKITMPNSYVLDNGVPGTGAYNTRKYDFSEGHLEACVKYVQDFLDNSQAKRKENLSAISKLIGENSDPEAPAE